MTTDFGLTSLDVARTDQTGGFGFYWELIDLNRKLVLTGWLLLVEKAVQARVLIALLVSVFFLSLHLFVKPLRRCAAAQGA